MGLEAINEARRQAEVCNACRYCEGYCSVFPELHSKRAFTDGDITHLANLCHNCQGCYYACQYTAPHAFDLNMPAALAAVRREAWEDYAWPQPFARAFHRSGVAIAAAGVVCFAAIFLLIQALPEPQGEGFYAIMSHRLMVLIFGPVFVLPLVGMGVSLRRYWRDIGGGRLGPGAVLSALKSAGAMRNLKGGHGDGCNFEDEDRFSHARRYAHQMIMYGFLLCFMSTASGTIMHYGFDWQAPYGPWTPPKLLGVPGGILLVIGTIWFAGLKLKSNREVGDRDAFGAEMAFVLLLFLTALSGLVLYLFGATSGAPVLLAIHFGAVACLFMITPYSKMVHGFYRLLALAKAGG